MPKRILTETEASGGSKENVVRYMLAGGLVLVILGFLVVFGLTSNQKPDEQPAPKVPPAASSTQNLADPPASR